MRVVIAGTGQLGMAVMEPLLESGHEVAGLVLNGRRTRSSIRRWFETSTLLGSLDAPVRAARRRRIRIFWMDDMSAEALKPISRTKPDLLITCGFGIILKKPALDLPAIGCINVHSSLLPKHRGPMPFNWVILRGDEQTGVTFHVTAESIDAGPILDQRSIPVAPSDTAMTVYRRCCELARQRVVAVVDRIAREGLGGAAQDEACASYDRPLTFEDFRIDWSKPAIEIDRLIRAATPYLPAHFTFRARRIDVDRCSWDAAPVSAAAGEVLSADPHVRVAAGAGSITILRAAMREPFLWPWPNALHYARAGSRLG